MIAVELCTSRSKIIPSLRSPLDHMFRSCYCNTMHLTGMLLHRSIGLKAFLACGALVRLAIG